MLIGRTHSLTRPWGVVAFSLAVAMIVSLSAQGVPYPAAAPDFNLPDLSGHQVRLADIKADNIVLFFGTTWCPHCEAALPELTGFPKVIDKSELEIIFISVREKNADVEKFVEKKSLPFRVLLDKTGLTANAYNAPTIPTCVFIDSDRQIQYIGRPREEIIWRLLSGERPVLKGPASNRMGATAKPIKPKPEDPKALKRFIVDLNEGPSVSKRMSPAARRARGEQYTQAAKAIGAKIIHNYGKLKNQIVVEIAADKADKLRQLPKFKSAKVDKPVHAMLEDSVYQIHADYAWDNAITGQGVKVCVVDTGIDYLHPDLANGVIAQYDATTDTNDCMDDNGHGTHVAGIIASQGLQYRGVSFDASLMGAKVLDYSGNGYSSDVAIGINWCVDNGAQVINLSLGEGSYSTENCDFEEMAQAVNAAVDAGVVVACASGNDGDLQNVVSPACASKAIAVGSVDKTDVLASYSDGGLALDVVAPGGDQFGGKNFPEIVSCYSTLLANDPFYCLYLVGDECYDSYFLVDGTRYIRAVGTSMASPHVAGAAALLLEENPSLTPAQVKTVLEQNADDLGDPGWDNAYGYGRINVEKSLENLPAEPSQLITKITEPNTSGDYALNEPINLAANIDCLGGDGCGNVTVHAQYSPGSDSNNFIDINDATPITTTFPNPNDLGVLSGCTLENDANLVFDETTVYDLSEETYDKTDAPVQSPVGSHQPGQYSTGDLEPGDGLVFSEGNEKVYDFNLPAGVIKKVSVRLENYFIVHFNETVLSSWSVYTADANGDSLHLIDTVIPAEGGGGDPPPPDCWFITEDPTILADFTPGGVNHIKLTANNVDEYDWLTFNDIEVIVDYQIDPNNDSVYRYSFKFDLSGIDTTADVGSALLKLNVAEPEADAVGELYVVDSAVSAGWTAPEIHECNQPGYTNLVNPVKTFVGSQAGVVSMNVKAALVEAIDNGESSLAFQVRERNSDQQFTLDAGGSANPPTLTIVQTLQQGCPGNTEQSGPDPNNGPRPLTYDTLAVKDVSADSYTKYDDPNEAVIGAEFAAEYSTGDLEPADGVVFAEGNEKTYGFTLPEGIIKKVSVRLENYFIVHFNETVLASWSVYTSDANGNSLHLIDTVIPAEGGGGDPPPPDCWFITEDPAIISDFTPGGTSYIKLTANDVDEYDWLTFNDIEVIVEYQVDPNNDHVSRYYVKFDVSELAPNLEVDSAHLNLNVETPGADAVGLVNLVDGSYDESTGAFTIFNAQGASYSSLVNPIKSFGADTGGVKKINVKPALEDSIESGVGEIAFLITEKEEDALFSLGAAAGPNAPTLDVYLKSPISGGSAHWVITPVVAGQYTVRVLAQNDVGIVGVSDEKVLTVFDPDLPTINSVQCMIDSTWQSCANAKYGDTIQAIRVDAHDSQQTPEVHATITNLPDNHAFLDDDLAFDGTWFSRDLGLTVTDSGDWRIDVLCTDSDSNTATQTVNWFIPWGRLATTITQPGLTTSVPKGGSFTVAASVQCLDAECPPTDVTLRVNNPVQTVYDDGSAEDYGDLGSTDSYMAVKFTPSSYPSQLRTARFYVWDKTTYPFELNVWDDNGSGGAPGTMLMTPTNVDPVAASDDEVAWFDVDLSDRNIVINNGSFYIGWRQLEDGKLNQVGFDNTGQLYRRTWGYLGGWFNLDDYCSYWPDVCGNLMIRAITSEPGTFSGTMPSTAAPAPLYTLDSHPERLASMGAGQQQTAQFTVRAVGATNQTADIDVVATNVQSADSDGPVKVTITAPLSQCDAANLDAAGGVDFKDLAVLLSHWDDKGTLQPADINNDGVTDSKDLAQLADFWLKSCQ